MSVSQREAEGWGLVSGPPNKHKPAMIGQIELSYRKCVTEQINQPIRGGGGGGAENDGKASTGCV